MRRLRLAPGSRVLDVAAGHGRHARYLAQGHMVVAADIDPAALRTLGSTNVLAVVADAARALPFAQQSFDLVLVVHFLAEGIVDRTRQLLRPDGYLLLETFGGQGANWRALPAPGALRDELARGFEILDYRERRVGPTRTEAVSVRLLAKRAA